MKQNVKPAPLATPMPVLMIGTYDEDGTPNLMNAAWGGTLDSDLFCLSLEKSHLTVANLERTKALTLGFPSASEVEACDYVGIVSGSKAKDKVKVSGLTPKKSETVDAPYFDEFPLTYECVVERIIDDPEYGYYVLARVKNILVEEGLSLGKGAYDVDKMGLILYTALDNTYRKVGEPVGKAFHCGLAKKGK